MQPDRRQFLTHVAVLTAAGTGALQAARAGASAAGHGDAAGAAAAEDGVGVLVDLNACIGCRLCEHACKEANGLDPGPLAAYDDQSVFARPRRPEPGSYTVVNAWPAPTGAPTTATTLSAATTPSTAAATTAPGDATTLYAKVNCVHCLRPACVSACIVGALERQPSGAVVYDPWKCIGCRYCMVACPMQLPAYDYHDALTPQVRKCQLCAGKLAAGERPACVTACPRQVMTFGKRSDILALAHDRIAKHPDEYVDHVYGEHEVGGTAWVYLSRVPFEQAGFLTLPATAPPVLTEKIQHGVFKHWIAPIGWYSFLASVMWWTGRREHVTAAGHPAESHGSALKDTPSASLAPAHRHERGSQDPPAATTAHAGPAPVPRKLLTPGVWVLIAMVLAGALFGLYRFIFGLAATTNLDQQHPWGLWIAMDVGSGIALAGGGFVAAAVTHIFHRERYHAVARSALLAALLGYTFYVPGLLADLGRWYNIWHPILPSMWQANSVLFEVGICVMLYLNVQYAELAPIVCERLLGEGWVARRPRVHRLVETMRVWLERILPALLVAGVALSTFHQSSLGNLMVIAPFKLHPLWWTPWSPVMFLFSAMMVGFPMVIFTILFASWSLRREPEMDALGGLARNYVPVFLSLYLVVKVGDMIWRGTHVYLLDGSYEGVAWLIEMLLGVCVPLAMCLMPRVRRSPRWLAVMALLVILGVILNRLNCFVLAYHPPYATRTYVPSLTEFMVSLGLVAALMLCYRVGVTYLPILEPRQKGTTP